MNDDIKQALDVLHRGGVILYPTDTIWGLGCDATNPNAVQRIYEIKKRSDSKSMLVLLDNQARLDAYVVTVPEMAWALLEVADKPLTIIYPNAKNLASNLVAADNSIGIRVSSDKFCNQLIFRFRKPIVSTSANISGTPAPAFFDEIAAEIKQQVDYIVTHRQDDKQKRKPSGIIKLGENNEVQIIRE